MNWSLLELDVLAAAWRDAEASGDLLAVIVTAFEAAQVASARYEAAVAEARRAGHSWQAIGAGLGLDRREAWLVLAGEDDDAGPET